MVSDAELLFIVVTAEPVSFFTLTTAPSPPSFPIWKWIPITAARQAEEGVAEFNGVIYGFGDHRQKMVVQRRYVKR